MSWGGPAVGTPAGYNPQQPHPGQPLGTPMYPTHAAPQKNAHRPPKKGGNKPIITRYPPPPGYRAPPQPQGPYGQYQYQNAQQPYSQGQPPASYPAPAYGATPAGYPPQQGYNPSGYAPPQGYAPQTGYPQQPHAVTQNYQYHQPPNPSAQGYPQPGYGVTRPPMPQAPLPQPQVWQPPHPQPAYPANAPYHAPPTASQLPQGNPAQDMTQSLPTANPSSSGHSQPLSAGPGKMHPFLTTDDEWDFDFDGPIWPKANDPVDPNLSLGVIIWKPPKPTTRALPSTFEEAEAQALKPPGKKIQFGESVSEYFTPENHYDAFVDIRETAVWDSIKDDPVFVQLPKVESMDLFRLDACIQMRDRPDIPVKECNNERQQAPQNKAMQDSSWSIMDNLEQALSGQVEEALKQPDQEKHQGTRKNQAQEDILARLGVTGSPKPPSDEPIDLPSDVLEKLAKSNSKPPPSLPQKPPVLPPDPVEPSHHPVAVQRAQSYGGSHSGPAATSSQRPYASFSAPVPERQQQHHPWNPTSSANIPNHHASAGAHPGPTQYASNGHFSNSQGSPTSATSKRFGGSWSRKRSHHDVDGGEHVDPQHHETKRKRSSLVSDPYGRR